MKAFLSIKYYDDMKNKPLMEKICFELENKGLSVFLFARDIQNYGSCKLTGKEVMDIAFSEIKKSDILIVEASEISIGVGIEAGVAYASNIPIYTIAQKDAYVSNSIKGISKKSFFYDIPEDLKDFEI